MADGCPHGPHGPASEHPPCDAHAVLTSVRIIETVIKDTLPYSRASNSGLESTTGGQVYRVGGRGISGSHRWSIPLVLVEAWVVVVLASPAAL